MPGKFNIRFFGPNVWKEIEEPQFSATEDFEFPNVY